MTSDLYLLLLFAFFGWFNTPLISIHLAKSPPRCVGVAVVQTNSSKSNFKRDVSSLHPEFCMNLLILSVRPFFFICEK